MGAPAPPVALANHVSSVYGNTLYTFQPDAFQSISLQNNSQWTQLPMGVSVNGSTALVANSGGQDSLFIVGGRSNSSEASFPGFQKYVFSSSQWEALQPETSVAQNRVQHGTAYLKDTSSILIFGGSQDNSYTPSSQTYTISANEPYEMKSYPAAAPAVQNPILLPFNSSHALMAGGGANQDEIWTFSEATGWVMMSTTIPGGVGDASKVQGVLTTDGSGNQQLELFDMSQSPNQVKTVSLSNKSTKREHQGRDVNASGAPTATRNGFSLAQAPSGLIVISGGTSDQDAGSLALFDQSKGVWEDPSTVFGTGVQTNGLNNVPIDGSSSAAGSASGTASAGDATASNGASSAVSGVSSAPASATSSGASPHAASATASATGSAVSALTSGATGAAASASSSSAAAAAASSSSDLGGDNTAVILAAVLGSFFGVAAIFFIALLIFRYRRNKASQKQQGQLQDSSFDEKRAGSPDSFNSLVKPRSRSPFQAGQIPTISRPQLVAQPDAESLAPPRALGGGGGGDDGAWGRYFANNNTVENLYPGAAAGAGAGLAAGAAAGHTRSSVSGANARNTQYTVASEYTIDSPTSTHGGGHESAIVAPLNPQRHSSQAHVRSLSDATDMRSSAHFFDNNNGRVAGGGQETTSSDPTRPSTSGSASVYASSASGHAARPASSVYYDRGSSVYPTSALSPGIVSGFPPVPSHPALTGNNNYGGSGADKGMRSIMSKDFGAGTAAAAPTRPARGSEVGLGQFAEGFTFPESATRRAGPGVEPRSAGSGNGMSGKRQDLSWVNFS